PRASAASVIAGIVAGEATVVFLTVTSASVATLLPGAPQVVKDLNVGFVALGINVVVLGLVAMATRTRSQSAALPQQVQT
ncbi:MAG: sodium:solute symporter family protein, partial [Gemmatimonadaceae bacterium]